MAKKKKNDVDWNKEQDSNNVELYARLVPYILRDFMHKSDLRNLLITNFLANGSPFIDIDTGAEGIKQALLYKQLLDDGDELDEKVKPVIKL